MRKEKKKRLLQQLISSASPYSAILESIAYVNNICNVCMYADMLFTFRAKRKQRICVRCCLHMWYSPKWRFRVTHFWIKSLFLFSLCTKYSRSFVKWQLNPWCHMDYFNDLLATFLSLDLVRILAVYGRVRKLSDFIKNTLIYVPTMNEGLMGLERHEDE